MKSVERSLDSPQDFARVLEGDLEQWSSLSGIVVEVWALPKEQLPVELAGLFRGLIHDVLAEVKRHASARTVSIALTTGPSGVRLTVSDDGAGMPVQTLMERLGPRHARLAALGGDLTINSVPLEGITVSGIVPRK
jgi:signal transduction histidine kinase